MAQRPAPAPKPPQPTGAGKCLSVRPALGHVMPRRPHQAPGAGVFTAAGDAHGGRTGPHRQGALTPRDTAERGRGGAGCRVPARGASAAFASVPAPPSLLASAEEPSPELPPCAGQVVSPRGPPGWAPGALARGLSAGRLLAAAGRGCLPVKLSHHCHSPAQKPAEELWPHSGER